MYIRYLVDSLDQYRGYTFNSHSAVLTTWILDNNITHQLLSLADDCRCFKTVSGGGGCGSLVHRDRYID
jgi:DNA recombination-dependent growth factor C